MAAKIFDSAVSASVARWCVETVGLEGTGCSLAIAKYTDVHMLVRQVHNVPEPAGAEGGVAKW